MVPKMLDTYSRRLNAVVTLAAIVLIGNGAIGLEITREQIPSGELKDLHAPETLAKRMAEYRWQKNGSPDSGVLRLLEETSDKARPKSILDQFSVDELIAMSKYRLSDCIADRITARQDDCGRLVGDSQMATLLARYCNNMSRAFEAWCGQQKNAIAFNALKSNGFNENMRIRVREFKAEMDEKLSAIYREQERTRFNFKKDELDQSVYESVIGEALRGHDIVKVESIKVVCRKMVDILSGILQVQADRTKPNFKARGLLAEYRYCEIVNKLSEKSTGEQ